MVVEESDKFKAWLILDIPSFWGFGTASRGSDCPRVLVRPGGQEILQLEGAEGHYIGSFQEMIRSHHAQTI